VAVEGLRQALCRSQESPSGSVFRTAKWFEERAAKLVVLRFELTHGPEPNKFKLAELVSKLDPKDREWAMKETDLTLLCRYAAEKAIQCQDNAGECARNADEINYRMFVFPLA